MTPDLAPLIEALHRALREQAVNGPASSVGDRIDGEGGVELHGHFRLAPLVEAVLAAQWRPIETAPKGGTLILLFDPNKSVNTGRHDRLSGWIAMPGVYDRQPTDWQPLGRPPTPA